nr:MAG TPA: hypothetical protein [Caudoviricetes sp.]
MSYRETILFSTLREIQFTGNNRSKIFFGQFSLLRKSPKGLNLCNIDL